MVGISDDSGSSDQRETESSGTGTSKLKPRKNTFSDVLVDQDQSGGGVSIARLSLLACFSPAGRR